METASLHSEEGRLEESLRAPEPLVTNGDDLTIGQLIGLLQGGGCSSSGHLLLEVQGDIAKLFLDVTDNFTLGGGGEGVATLCQDLHQVVGELTASQVQTDDGMGKSITFIDGDTVGDTVTGVHHDTSGTAGGVQGKYGLDGDIHGGHVEGLKHNLGHLLPVGFGVEGGLSQQDGLLLGVLKGQDTPLGLGLISNIGILLSHTDHHTLVTGTANNGGEDGAGSVISGEPSLAHAGAIVDNQGSNVLVTHLGSGTFD